MVWARLDGSMKLPKNRRIHQANMLHWSNMIPKFRGIPLPFLGSIFFLPHGFWVCPNTAYFAPHRPCLLWPYLLSSKIQANNALTFIILGPFKIASGIWNQKECIKTILIKTNYVILNFFKSRWFLLTMFHKWNVGLFWFIHMVNIVHSSKYYGLLIAGIDFFLQKANMWITNKI